ASGLGPEGRKFKSCCPDHNKGVKMKKLFGTLLFLMISNTAFSNSFTCNNGQEMEGLEILDFKLSDDKKTLTYANRTVEIKDDGKNYVWVITEKPYPMNPKKTLDVKRELKKDLSGMIVYGLEKIKWKCTKK
ncbi:MAG: hypothetical protein VW228_01480, partial [Pelagibacteraceae bacterium]